MNLTTILSSPVVVLLLKWTSLLALAWGAHGLCATGMPAGV